ncbi:hypothetical protein J6590_090905 [Homalodisca vitripennis]|nr:hypothetical protein J6590_090905 [Homalodisca vitripennis]
MFFYVCYCYLQSLIVRNTTIILPPPAPAPPAPSTPDREPSAPGDSTAEILRLRREIERLKKEYDDLLNHTIESDTRLLQFTDQIFTANTPSRVDQNVRASVMVDCGVQCDLPTQTTICTMQRCTETAELYKSLKTTSEVLEADNQYLTQQLKAYECGDQPHEQAWTEIKNKNKNKKKPTGQTTMNRHHTPPTKTLHPNPKAPHHRKSERPPIEKTKQKHPSQKYRKPSQTSIPFIHKVHINGDSHTRHIAELVYQLTCPATSVGGKCMPGARLLDVLKPTPTFPEPGPRCEVLIAGTNDLAVGTQRNIYRHLEPYITTRASNTELLVATLPHRHDLHPAHPIHDETVLVNAYIEELAVRHNFRVLKFHELSRRYFTRHGQHLSMRGKRVLAEIIVKSLTATQRPVKTVPPPFEPTPAATRHPAIRRSTSNHQDVSYAEALCGAAALPTTRDPGHASQLDEINMQNFLGTPLIAPLKI